MSTATPPKVKVLIVDDSSLIRHVVTKLLAEEPDLDVVGSLSSGEFILTEIERKQPDIVVLDLEMPIRGGLETLEVLRPAHPDLPVLMFSAHTSAGAVQTLDAIALGASDYIAKPAGCDAFAEVAERIRSELATRIRALCGRSTTSTQPKFEADNASFSKTAAHMRKAAQQRPFQAMVVAASTGGPNALSKFLSELPTTLPIPVFVVQHMPEEFTKILAERLDRECQLNVREASDGELGVPGDVLIAPGDYHMTVDVDPLGGRVRLDQNPQVQSCRPSADVLFNSACDAFAGTTLAVVLTGMGQDGGAGCQSLHTAGAHIIVQDEASSVVWGMPGYVSRAGLSDAELPLDQIANSVLVAIASRDAQGNPVNASPPPAVDSIPGAGR